MKILFIENRYATLIWDAIARGLEARGHEIHWIIQNPLFKPTVGEKYVLPFPSTSEKKQDDSLLWLKDVDRGVRWFGGDGTHWHPYNKRIRDILESVMPDVVFGEPTQFHEQLVLENARQLGIRFLSPCGTRYPVGRLHFFDYDTLNPVGGEGVDLNDAELEKMLDTIVERKVVPSYMEVIPQPMLKRKLGMLKNKLLITAGWLLGERYITPSPLTKLRLERAHAKQYLEWETFAQEHLPESLQNKPWVLYPLQMQPEANIELWGKPWSYQAEVVKRAAQSLEKLGAVLVVKPNPKSKYELTSELCELVKNSTNILAISHTTKMKELFQQAPLVMTVTGTVLLECVFSGKPVASLGNHAMTRYPGVQPLNEPEDLDCMVQNLMSDKIEGATRDEAKTLLNYLYKTSYQSTIFDPLTQPELLNDININHMLKSFELVLTNIKNNEKKSENKGYLF